MEFRAEYYGNYDGMRTSDYTRTFEFSTDSTFENARDIAHTIIDHANDSISYVCASANQFDTTDNEIWMVSVNIEGGANYVNVYDINGGQFFEFEM